MLYCVLLVFAALAWTAHFIEWNFDDAYIVYRIVSNLLAGHGWCYNVGEVHNASTSVLNTVLTAAVAKFTSMTPQYAGHVVGFLALCGGGISLYELLKRHGTDQRWALAGAILFQAHLAFNESWGIETNLFIATLLATLLVSPLSRWHGTILGVVVLIRPDGMLFALLRGIREWRVGRKFPWWSILTGAVVLLPWVIYSLVTFSEIFPDTLSEKIWQGRSGLWGEGWIYFKGLYQHLLMSGWGPRALLVFGVIGMIAVARQRSVIVDLALFVILQQCIYGLVNIPAYHWYYATFDGVLMIAATVIIVQLLHSRLPGWGAWVATLGGVVLMGRALVGPTPHDMRDLRYRSAIQAIEAEKLPEGPLAVVEVGTVGYFTSRTIVDLTGLTSPRGEFITGARNDLFFADPPTLVVVHAPLWKFERPIVEDPRFAQWFEGPFVAGDRSTRLRYYVQRRGLMRQKEQL